jgi:phosphonopyruvate decarboxylase
MSINPIDFYNALVRNKINFFTGVPDSLLKEFCLTVDDNVPKKKHIIGVNEGSSIAIGAGYYLSTDSLPLIYLQNSGLGNAINPILSLCDQDVYSIPMIIMIGWRGEPGVKDEPQHLKQGKIQTQLLDTMAIPYNIISSADNNRFEKIIDNSVIRAKESKSPVALLIKKGTFNKYGKNNKVIEKNKMSRENALEVILKKLNENYIVVSTTGKTSREIFEIRKNNSQSHRQDFLTVGSMGHCSSIAFGIALSKPNQKVLCIDGDGALLMHLGSLATISSYKPKNFKYILMNNKVHESVGGQDTAAKHIKLSNVIKSITSTKIYEVNNLEELTSNLDEFLINDGPSFMEVKIKPGSRSDLGRPTIKPIDNKNSFMDFIKNK